MTISPRNTTRPLYFWCFGSNSAFFKWQMSINDAKWTLQPLFLASSTTSDLLLTFVCCHAGIFASFFIISPLPPLHQEFLMLAVMWSWRSLCPAPSSLDLVLSSTSTTQAYFVLRFPILRWVSPLQHCCWHRNFQLLRAAFIVSLNSSSFGSMKYIPLNCLAFSSFGFSIAHLCFAYFFLHQTYPSTHLATYCLVLRLFVSLNLHSDEVCPSGGLSSRRTNLVNLVHASDTSFSPSTFQLLSICCSINTPNWCMSGSGNVDVLQRNKKWFFFRRAQFDSGFNVLAINQMSCNFLKISFSFRIIQCRVILKWCWKRVRLILLQKLFFTCGMNTVIQHSEVNSETRKITNTFHREWNQKLNIPCICKREYLMCLGHFENLLNQCGTGKIHDLCSQSLRNPILRDNLATSTLLWSSHWKFHRGWSQHRRSFVTRSTIP